MKKLGIYFFLLFSFISSQMQAQEIWVSTNGPYGGTIDIIAQDPLGNLYASANDVYNIYFFDLSSSRWEKKNLPGIEGFYRISSIAFNQYSHLFLGTWLSLGVLRSLDNGSTWALLDSGLQPHFNVNCVSIDKQNRIFIGTDYGLYMSNDNGDNWEWLAGGSSFENGLPGQIGKIVFFDSTTIFAGSDDDDGGLYKSENSGKTWDEIQIGTLDYPFISALVLNNEKDIFVSLFDTDIGKNAIYLSDDVGESWKRINDSISKPYSLVIGNNNWIFCGSHDGQGLFRSTDNGNSWEDVNNGLTHKDIHKITIDSENYIYLATEGGGVFYSNNHGDSWKQMNDGILELCPSSFLEGNNGKLYTGCLYSGVYIRETEDRAWKQINTNLPYQGLFELISNSFGQIFTGTNDGVYRLDDQSDSWVYHGLDSLHITTLTEHENHLFAGTRYGGFYQLVSGGDTWLKISELPDLYYQSSTVSQNGDIFISASHNPNLIYRSQDVGETWENVGNDLPASDHYIVSSDSFGAVYCGLTILGYNENRHQIFKSSDNGENWEKRYTSDFSNSGSYMESIVIDRQGNIYACIFKEGLIFSNDKGQTWNSLNDGLPSNNVYDIFIDHQDFLYVGTVEGVYKSSQPISILSINKFSDPDSRSFHLYQNYPNPFNTSTTIKYQILQPGYVEIRLYSIDGKLVDILVDEHKSAGEFSVKWHAKDLASGIYFYVLIHNEKVIYTKCLLLIK